MIIAHKKLVPRRGIYYIGNLIGVNRYIYPYIDENIDFSDSYLFVVLSLNER